MDAQVSSGMISLIGSIVGAIVWLVRLEGKVLSLEKQIAIAQKEVDSLQIKHEALDSKVVEQLASVRESLARIEGALGVKKGE